MPDIYCPQPHGPHRPPASPGWGPCSGHTKQGAQGTKGGGRECPVSSPPPHQCRGRQEGNKRSSHSWALMAAAMATFPRQPLATGHCPWATGQPWPLAPTVAPPSACLAPHLSPCSLHLSVCLLPICPASCCPRPGGGQRGGGGERWVPQCLAEILLPHQNQPHNWHQPHNQPQPLNQHHPHTSPSLRNSSSPRNHHQPHNKPQIHNQPPTPFRCPHLTVSKQDGHPMNHTVPIPRSPSGMGTHNQHQPHNQHYPYSIVARWDRSLVTSSSPIANTIPILLSLPCDGQVEWAPPKQHQPHNQHQPSDHRCLHSLVAEQERSPTACTVPT